MKSSVLFYFLSLSITFNSHVLLIISCSLVTVPLASPAMICS